MHLNDDFYILPVSVIQAPDKFSFRGCKFRVKRCKESTGRVVMWRQMNIANSFTMEATFCGAKNMERY